MLHAPAPLLPTAFALDELMAQAASPAYPAFLRDGRMAPEALGFLQQYHEDALDDDLSGLSAADCAGLAHALWAVGQARADDTQFIGIEAAQAADGRILGRDLIHIVGPDMPFLVDSVIACLSELSVRVLAMFHPVVSTARAADGTRADQGRLFRESYIQVHVEMLAPHRHKACLDALSSTLRDVRLAGQDGPDIRNALAQARAHLLVHAPDQAATQEAVAFLDWLTQGHFSFLGLRLVDYVRGPDGALVGEEPGFDPAFDRGILRVPGRFILRRGAEPTVISQRALDQLRDADAIIVAKSNLRAQVHRRSLADYVGVKRYRADGEPIGEWRFLGLFSPQAYDQPASDIPLLASKIAQVLARCGKPEGGHSAKRLRSIVENWPRDELFQISQDDLLASALGVLHLVDRPRAKCFVRRDRFDRSVSILAFVPRERYTTQLRERLGLALAQAWGGQVSAYHPHFADGPLARVLFSITLAPGHPEPDQHQLDQIVSQIARGWADRFEDGLRALAIPEDVRQRLLMTWGDAFPAAYQDSQSAQSAYADIEQMEQLSPDRPVGVRLGLSLPATADGQNHGPPRQAICVYSRGGPLPLHAMLPILENMGLQVLEEHDFRIQPQAMEQNTPAGIHLHELIVQSHDLATSDLARLASTLPEAFVAVWSGQAENDGFNRLIVQAGCDWRQASLLRALARYRQQSGLDPSQSVQEAALGAQPQIARCLLDLFAARFDPDLGQDLEVRARTCADLMARIEDLLAQVASLDADRALRRIAALVMAIQRTNFYQRDAQGRAGALIAFKIASQELADLPNPKPWREIFVASPDVEAVHLRFGAVARGGLRWSDRRDDFRTEVLGLVKAQQVKNAVIVPVGAKGGFFPKRLPRQGSPAQVRAEAVRAYSIFLGAMLDLTDNLAPDGTVLAPARTLCWDGVDPYLVAAADKGTATFSDIANAIALERGFWLGDAYASGGSNGYDHKAMGITARGAWEAVKRHFREMGKDIQTQAFTVIGVGDMSGDVFGNGMLLSRQIGLLAAFDHRDIFIDPQPDPEASFAERARLFALPQSSWQSYDRALISTGGGVFSRQAKAIALTPQIKALTGLEADTCTPSELIHALLQAPCELLWFGGIGTYVKAAHESHAQIGDKANDAIRVNAEALRARVVGEGANLAVTQPGRIAFARLGGAINTDAIDNSAGVDTSDHEVNIKILLADAMAEHARRLSGSSQHVVSMEPGARANLLVAMTSEVAAKVLAHNYRQTFALSLAVSQARADIDAHERLMQVLEKAGRLDRALEHLPGSGEMAQLKARGLGLTRPELAVLVAYVKLDLSERLVAGHTVDDPGFTQTLIDYFPQALAPMAPLMAGHRLRRELIATRLANEIVDLGGPLFVLRAKETANVDIDALALGFAATRAIFETDEIVHAIDALDSPHHAKAQLALSGDLEAVVRRHTIWLARRARGSDGHLRALADLISAYQSGVQDLKAHGPALFGQNERARFDQRTHQLIQLGAPVGLAQMVAALSALQAAGDMIDLGRAHDWQRPSVGVIHFACGEILGLDRLRTAANDLPADQYWEQLALRRTAQDFQRLQTQVCAQVMALAHSLDPDAARHRPQETWASSLVEDWVRRQAIPAQRALQGIAELEAGGPWTFAKLGLASALLQEWITAS